MTLDTILDRLGFSQHSQASLETQLNAMRREVRHITKMLARNGSREFDDWSGHMGELGRDASMRAAQLAELAGHQAMKGAKHLRNDPLPAIAVIGTGLLLARLLQRR